MSSSGSGRGSVELSRQTQLLTRLIAQSKIRSLKGRKQNMGPKAASPDERLQFILQCLHSIKDANGRLMTPDWKAVALVTGIKRNSCYVRYRDIVNKEIQNGTQGLSPVGSRANAAAAANAQLQPLEQASAIGSQPTPTSTPGGTSVPTARSSPAKPIAKKRRRPASDGDDEYDEEDTTSSTMAGANKRIKDDKGFSRPAKQQVYQRTTTAAVTEPDLSASFLDFDAAAHFLAMGDGGLELYCSTDADAEGEDDDEY